MGRDKWNWRQRWRQVWGRSCIVDSGQRSLSLLSRAGPLSLELLLLQLEPLALLSGGEPGSVAMLEGGKHSGAGAGEQPEQPALSSKVCSGWP